MGKVVDITDRLPLRPKRPGRPAVIPETTFWSFKQELDEDGNNTVCYEFSHPEFLATEFGMQVEMRKLANIILYFASDDPALGADLLKSLEEVYLDED